MADRVEALRGAVGSCLPVWEPEDRAVRATLSAIVTELGITRERVDTLEMTSAQHDATCTGYLDGACDCESWPKENANIAVIAAALTTLLDAGGEG